MKHPNMSGLISSAQTRQTVWLVSCTVVIVLLSIGNIDVGWGCNLFNYHRNTNTNCKPSDTEPGDYYFNIPILTSVYCFNNGTGICKVLAGRFEFYMNSWTQEYLGPVKRDSEHEIDQHGYHKRVPVTYTIDGTVLYHDRAINWSLWFTKGNTKRLRLLSSTSFKWCEYAHTNNWPYKSAILDRTSGIHIYFFNRQACIYDPNANKMMHYNTRFTPKDRPQIDLDYNPTIWAMEVQKGDVRLIKHKRELLTESKWSLEKSPTSSAQYFVKMEEVEKKSAVIAGKGPFIRREFYSRSTNSCVSDFYSVSVVYAKKPSEFRIDECGVDSREFAVYGNLVDYRGREGSFILEAGFLNVPFSTGARDFVLIEKKGEYYEDSVSLGYALSAATLIQDEKALDHFQLIRLSYKYQDKPSGDFDEQYPKTYIETVNASAYLLSGAPMFSIIPDGAKVHTVPHKDLNYVDDIEYLPRCKTILVIFGPLYTEYPVKKFDVTTETLIGSIYKLGANELINAFFAKGDKLFFYHRLNFVTEHIFTCAKSADELVTATPAVKYYFRFGTDVLDVFPKQWPGVTNHQEEKLFQDLGIFQGSLGPPDAPDATQFDYDPVSKTLPWWAWLLILLGASLLIGMLGLYAYRRRLRQRRYLAQTQRSSSPDSSSGISRITARSGGLQSNRVSPHMTQSTRVSSGASRSQSSSSRRRASGPGGRSQSSRSSNKPSGMSSRSPSKFMKNSSHSQSRSASREPSSSRPSGTASHGQSRPR